MVIPDEPSFIEPWLWGMTQGQSHRDYTPLKKDTSPAVVARGSFRGAKPLFKNHLPLPLVKGKGIKRVPRKIEDFSGCLKGIGLPNTLLLPLV